MKRSGIVVCLLLTLAGCSGGSNGPTVFTHSVKARPAPAAKPTLTPAEQTEGMSLASSPAHGADFGELKFEFAKRPVAGEPLAVDLALLPKMDASTATIVLSGMDGLEVGDESARVDFADLTQGGVYRKTVFVTPGASGVVFLNASVTLAGQDFSQSRTFTIPVIVDPAAASHAGGQ